MTLLLLAAAALVGVACSSDAVVAPPTTISLSENALTTSPPESAAPVDTATVEATTATEPAAPVDTTAVVAETTPAVLTELDDLDEDGSFDERCGTTDLGGGLMVATLCNTALTATPEGGVLPVPGSLLTLPTPSRWEDLANVDATVKVSSRPDGSRVVIYVLGSDTLFDSGSASVRSTAQPPLAAIVASIATRFPGSPITVRGAADSVGEPEANQSLSEQRAAAVAQQLMALGLNSNSITSVGLGEDVPVASETNADGSISEIGRQVNRRVEIVVG